MTVITNQMWLFYKNASHLNQGRKIWGGGRRTTQQTKPREIPQNTGHI